MGGSSQLWVWTHSLTVTHCTLYVGVMTISCWTHCTQWKAVSVMAVFWETHCTHVMVVTVLTVSWKSNCNHVKAVSVMTVSLGTQCTLAGRESLPACTQGGTVMTPSWESGACNQGETVSLSWLIPLARRVSCRLPLYVVN